MIRRSLSLFFLWRRLLGDFRAPSRKKNTPFLISQGYSEIWRCRGLKDLRADSSSYILSEYNKCHHPLTVYSFRSLPWFPLTNIFTCFRLLTQVGKDSGVGTREKRGERGGGGGREKVQRQKK